MDKFLMPRVFATPHHCYTSMIDSIAESSSINWFWTKTCLHLQYFLSWDSGMLLNMEKMRLLGNCQWYLARKFEF
ncbi:hypothetical protein M9H77_09333 [Catharanthus roseus]|uniref:Uncharacterized protein n=1 Tax=Catharanthus roseus TaxID=4058 RepID=A0ACC0C099_CATRO|nr:hypothetical protein M9H77_09333 [Catharanthus roseus]